MIPIYAYLLINDLVKYKSNKVKKKNKIKIVPQKNIFEKFWW